MLATTKGLVGYAPAKLNFYFELLARRGDGYHDVETLMVPVSLYDTLTFQGEAKSSQRSGSIHLQVQMCGERDRAKTQTIPQGQDNLVVRALELLQRQSGVTLGARVTLEKRIPAQAGLGGGSSDAATALTLANRCWGLRWPTERLIELAAEIGSDVPFFLSPGAKVGRGRGEQLTQAPPIGRVCAVIVVPPEGLSTADVYRASQVPKAPRNIEPSVIALQVGSLRCLKNTLHNRLQEAACRLSPWIDRIGSAMEELGCHVHQMTGSGSGYFGLCRHMDEANRLARRLQVRSLGQVFSVSKVG
jgi:4-diphosphocytidyl-2-C-methyl-D-erythritol kinase